MVFDMFTHSLQQTYQIHPPRSTSIEERHLSIFSMKILFQFLQPNKRRENVCLTQTKQTRKLQLQKIEYIFIDVTSPFIHSRSFPKSCTKFSEQSQLTFHFHWAAPWFSVELWPLSWFKSLFCSKNNIQEWADTVQMLSADCHTRNHASKQNGRNWHESLPWIRKHSGGIGTARAPHRTRDVMS